MSSVSGGFRICYDCDTRINLRKFVCNRCMKMRRNFTDRAHRKVEHEKTPTS